MLTSQAATEPSKYPAQISLSRIIPSQAKLELHFLVSHTVNLVCFIWVVGAPFGNIGEKIRVKIIMKIGVNIGGKIGGKIGGRLA